tara:strand:+ start:41 stop:718 length:678 start_codon:yes stop_codon:yes gene_type:complete
MKTKTIQIEIPVIEHEMGRMETYAMTAFIALRALKASGMWRNPLCNVKNEGLRANPRPFYDLVFSYKTCGLSTGLISDLYGNSDDMTWDHILSPQTGGEFALDSAEKFLTDFKLFKRFFECMCSTIRIYKTQNTELSDLKHTTPTMYKYKELGIPLYNKITKKEVDNLIVPNNYVCDGFWEEYFEWECKMVLTEDSKYGKPLPEDIECAQKKYMTTTTADLREFL